MISKRIKTLLLIISILMVFGLNSCIEEPFTTDPEARLEFSTDTVRFDTIFSTIPSITLQMRVYNRHNKAIKIDRISLENGKSSFFRFNADGYSAGEARELRDIVVGAKDSIFIFIETTLDESGKDLPIYASDHIVFEANRNVQKVLLEAYGQDAVILRSYSLKDNETFTADKPYLIFDFLHIPQGKTLTIEAGARLYLHKTGSKILQTSLRRIALNNTCIVVEGNIKMEGTHEQRILLRGDRFDLAYTNVPYSFLPAQWGGIYLLGESGENRINCTDIVGGEVGIQLMGNSSLNIPLELSNSTIHCMSSYGIYSLYGNLKVSNTEVSNCGASCISQWGGQMQLTHSTLANYLPAALNGGQQRKEAALSVISFIKTNREVVAYPVTSCVVENSIIFGNLSHELTLKDTTLGIPFNLFMSHCLVKSPIINRHELQNIFWSNEGTNIVFAQPNPDFDDIKKSGYFNFQLSENSQAIDRANPNVSLHYPTDLKGMSRLADTKPDIGAYEKK